MRGSISLFMLIAVLCASLTGALALDETKYPDWKGQWVRAHGAEAAPWDARKSDVRRLWGLDQQPPLIPEYQTLFEANLKQLAAGVKTSDPTTRCYVVIDSASTLRRTFIDGPHLLRNEITAIDNALSRPSTVTQSYRRIAGAQPIWTERICSDDSQTIRIGEEDYALGGDGLLMPVRKGQPPPDLRYFDQTRN